MDEIVATGVDPVHAGRYIACALTIAFAAAGALPIMIINCLMLMVLDP